MGHAEQPSHTQSQYIYIYIYTKTSKILIWSKENNKKNLNLFKTFLKRKNKHYLIRKFNPT